MIGRILGGVVFGMLVLGCAAGDDDLDRRNKRNGGADGTDDPAASADPTQPGTCAEGKPHMGFANTDFVGDRKLGAIGADRRRVKPYSALVTEFERVLGRTPTALTTGAAAYGNAPARWLNEPSAGAVSLYTTYSAAFTGCYDAHEGGVYASAPTAETALAECTTMQKSSWQRSPTPEESAACVALATTGVASVTDPRRRWAHVCAAILGAAGFTTY